MKIFICKLTIAICLCYYAYTSFTDKILFKGLSNIIADVVGHMDVDIKIK